MSVWRDPRTLLVQAPGGSCGSRSMYPTYPFLNQQTGLLVKKFIHSVNILEVIGFRVWWSILARLSIDFNLKKTTDV